MPDFRKWALYLLFLISKLILTAQSVNKGDIIFNANIGVPHLSKTLVKIAVKTPQFQKYFEGVIEISSVRGMNPIAVRGEYAINETFGIGVNFSAWNIKFDVKDYYNGQNQSYGNIYTDSVDIYALTIKSKSFGIRPNFHFPIDNYKLDVYFGIGLGITSNKLNVNFNSTDAGRFTTKYHKGLDYDIPMPGFIYFAPTIGLRKYLNRYAGFNFEIGYEKGALLLAGFVFRFNPDKAVRDKQKE